MAQVHVLRVLKCKKSCQSKECIAFKIVCILAGTPKLHNACIAWYMVNMVLTFYHSPCLHVTKPVSTKQRVINNQMVIHKYKARCKGHVHELIENNRIQLSHYKQALKYARTTSSSCKK